MSVPWAQRYSLWVASLALGVLVVVSMVVGDSRLSLTQLYDGLLRRDDLAAMVLWNIRIPRTLISVLVGGALASSGLVMQAYFRNSLASPGLLGVSSGGAAGAVVMIGLGWEAHSIFILPAASVAGAFVAIGAVILLARRGASTERLLLAGVALNALLGAVTSYVLSNVEASYDRNVKIIFWLIGGLEDRTWEHVTMAAPIVAAAALLWPLGRPMDLLSLGTREALSLGVDVKWLRRWMLVLSTVLTALATAVAGSVGFVGLVVPHLLRLLVGPEHRRLVPLTLIAGAEFVLGCDLICRSVGGLRVGVVTALVGGPYFLWLLRKQA